MRILIDNSGYELLNLGDAAMLQVAVRRLRAGFPAADLLVLTNAPPRLAALCPDAQPLSLAGRRAWSQERNLLGGLHRLMPRGVLNRLEEDLRQHWPHAACRWVARRLGARGIDTRDMQHYLDTLAHSNLVVVSGGGFLTDAFAPHALEVLATLELALALGVPCAMLGQGIGPISAAPLVAKVRRVLPRLGLIGLREGRAGPPLLRRWGVPPSRIVVTGDDAVALAYEQRAPTLGQALGVNLRTADYAGAGPAALDAVRDVLGRFAEAHGITRVPLPVSYHAGGEDQHACAALAASSAWQPLERPEALIARVGQCRVVVTGSYHAAVFALAQGISVVALGATDYYRNKFAGLAQLFGAGCAMVALTAADHALAPALERAWESAPQLRKPLLHAAAQQIAAGEAAWSRLVPLVGAARAEALA